MEREQRDRLIFVGGMSFLIVIFLSLLLLGVDPLAMGVIIVCLLILTYLRLSHQRGDMQREFTWKIAEAW